MRAGFSDIPAWQLALNILVLFIAAAFAVWLAGRAFRLGMLSYGKRLKLRDLFVRG
jgi:ABC-2 type transport system permease protein